MEKNIVSFIDDYKIHFVKQFQFKQVLNYKGIVKSLMSHHSLFYIFL